MSASVVHTNRRFAHKALFIALTIVWTSFPFVETAAEGSPAPPALSESYPLKVSVVTVSFERSLDLDHNEHAYLITTFALENMSMASICEIWASTSFGTVGLSRSGRLWYVKTLKPGEIRWFDDQTMLDEDAYKALRDVPLERVSSHWKTEKIKMCDGTILDTTASQQSY